MQRAKPGAEAFEMLPHERGARPYIKEPSSL